jgi:hypothetical protein
VEIPVVAFSVKDWSRLAEPFNRCGGVKNGVTARAMIPPLVRRSHFSLLKGNLALL